MEEIDTVLRNFCDEAMQEYIESEEFAKEQDVIIAKITELRECLNSRQKQLLNQLIDDINISDSHFSYESFKRGVVIGMIFSKKVNFVA